MATPEDREQAHAPERKLVRAHIEERDWRLCKELAAKNHWSLDFVVRRIVNKWADAYLRGEDIGVDVPPRPQGEVSPTEQAR